jgi:hypothetical protein
MSIQFRILFGLFFLGLAGSAILLWFALAWGNGFWAMAAPLGVSGLLGVLSWNFMRKL